MEYSENNQDNGLELLKKVIETNEENIAQLIRLKFVSEDLLNLKGETEASVRGLNLTILKLIETFKNEKQEREKFLEKIPKNIETQFSEDSLNHLNNFEKKSKSMKYLFFGSIGVLLLSVLVIFMSSFFAKKWYSESIKTKSEIREEILNEIKNDGKGIYKASDYEQLRQNTILINKWIERNPKDSEGFMKFKEGFEAR